MRFQAYAVKIPEQWFANHPGGAGPLLRHQGEDITALFQALHSGSLVAFATHGAGVRRGSLDLAAHFRLRENCEKRGAAELRELLEAYEATPPVMEVTLGRAHGDFHGPHSRFKWQRLLLP